MKYAIMIMAMAAGLAHGQFNVITSPTNIVETGTVVVTNHPVVTNYYPSDQFIKSLIENGGVCRVRGKHEWRYFTPLVFEWTSHKDWDADSGRKCDLCGRKEIKQEEWKEDGK